MECKFDDLGSLAEEYIELIDTLWNVNFSRRLAPALIRQELIDTLWNVNETGRNEVIEDMTN